MRLRQGMHRSKSKQLGECGGHESEEDMGLFHDDYNSFVYGGLQEKQAGHRAWA